MIPFFISVVWLGIGIRQWFMLSKWSKSSSTIENYRSIDGSNEDKGKQE
jgi:hypothetical protein